MFRIWIIMVLLIVHNESKDTANKTKRNSDDSFDIQIGAGYGIGIDNQTNQNPPKSTTSMRHSKSYKPKPSFSLENKPLETFQEPIDINNKKRYVNMHGFIPSKLQNFQIYEASNDEHNLLKFPHADVNQFHTIVNGIEPKFSKLEQVIKVPAVYEIHLQSHNQLSKSPHSISFDRKTDPTSQTDDYTRWINSYYKNKENNFMESNRMGSIDVLENKNLPNPNINHHINEHGIVVNGKPEDSFDLPMDHNSVDILTEDAVDSNSFGQNYNSQMNQFDSPQSHLDLDEHEPFRYSNHHSREILNFNKPQAIYEVPAPYLGNHKPSFNMESLNYHSVNSKTPIRSSIQYQEPVTKSNNVVQSIYSTLTPILPFEFPEQQNFDPEKPMVNNVKNDRLNLIYGKRKDLVLAPSQINIQLNQDVSEDVAGYEHVSSKQGDLEQVSVTVNNKTYYPPSALLEEKNVVRENFNSAPYGRFQVTTSSPGNYLSTNRNRLFFSKPTNTRFNSMNGNRKFKGYQSKRYYQRGPGKYFGPMMGNRRMSGRNFGKNNGRIDYIVYIKEKTITGE